MSSVRDNPSVNRYLKDKAMDLIDHALGRPVWPLRETYRNHFATVIDGVTAKAFDASPFWERIPASGSMAFYRVADAGRAALDRHLAALERPWRAYAVYYEGQCWIEPAKSRGNVRYRAWLKISDLYSELTFAGFCRASKVRIAA